MNWMHGLPDWTTALGLLAHLAVGVALGTAYFHGLWWNARLFAAGASLPVSIGLVIGRFALLGGVLMLASLEGALPLLAMALGVLVARWAVVHGVGRPAS